MFIVVKAGINVKTNPDTGIGQKGVQFKNNAPFRWYITKIKNTLIENAENLAIMLMYNLLEYGSNYSMTTWSLWNYCRDEVNDVANENNGHNYRINSNETTKK